MGWNRASHHLDACTRSTHTMVQSTSTGAAGIPVRTAHKFGRQLWCQCTPVAPPVQRTPHSMPTSSAPVDPPPPNIQTLDTHHNSFPTQEEEEQVLALRAVSSRSAGIQP